MTEFYEKLNHHGYYEAEPKPSADYLSKYYKDKYFQDASGTYAPEYLPEELRYFENIAKVSLETSRHLKLTNSLLDLGCGEGFFTKSFHSFNWDVLCTDFSNFGIKKHNNDMLPFFLGGDLFEMVQKLQDEGKTFGLINLQNVLEHVIDPQHLLHSIKPLLSSNSALRIRVPNDYSDFQKALVEEGYAENTWFAPPEHLSYFNNQGLTQLLAHCGYELLSLQANFPIELFLANQHSNYWKDKTLGKSAHLTRVFCENHLIEKNISDYIQYTESAAKLGFGRELIAYVKLKK